MMRAKLTLLMSLLLMALAVLPATAQDDDTAILLETDLEATPLPAELEINGNWETTTQLGNTFLRGTGVDWNDFIDFGTDEWTDYAVEMDVRIAVGTFYLDLRMGDASCDVYEFLIRPAANLIGLLELQTLDGDCDVVDTLDEDTRFSFPENTWQRIRLEAIGDTVNAYIEDELVMTATDTSYTQGNARITVDPEGSVDIDNIIVYALGDAAETVASGSASDLAGNLAQQLQQASGGSNTNSATPTAVPQPQSVTLFSFDGTHQDAVAELEALDVVPTGGRLLFREDYAWFQGAGNWFTPLAAGSPRQDVVVSGEITFNIGNTEEFEYCTLTSRIQTNNRGSATNYLDVGLTSDGGVFINDVWGEGVFEFMPLNLDMSVPHHILYTVFGDAVTVFVDGELVFEAVTVGLREGTYGIALIGETRETRCEGRNIWVYQYD